MCLGYYYRCSPGYDVSVQVFHSELCLQKGKVLFMDKSETRSWSPKCRSSCAPTVRSTWCETTHELASLGRRGMQAYLSTPWRGTPRPCSPAVPGRSFLVCIGTTQSHDTLAPLRMLIAVTPRPTYDIPSKVFDTVSPRETGLGHQSERRMAHQACGEWR